MFGQRFQVELTADCIKHGGREEYPDGRIGVETPPSRIVEQARGDDGNVSMGLVAELYREVGAVRHEGLKHLAFGEKTAWVPEWLLRPIVEATTPAAQ